MITQCGRLILGVLDDAVALKSLDIRIIMRDGGNVHSLKRINRTLIKLERAGKVKSLLVKGTDKRQREERYYKIN